MTQELEQTVGAPQGNAIGVAISTGVKDQCVFDATNTGASESCLSYSSDGELEAGQFAY